MMGLPCDNHVIITSDVYKRKSQQSEKANDTSMANLAWTSAPLRVVTMMEEMQYDDAFTLQRVNDLSEFNFMAGMVPFLQKLIVDVGIMLCPA